MLIFPINPINILMKKNYKIKIIYNPNNQNNDLNNHNHHSNY